MKNLSLLAIGGVVLVSGLSAQTSEKGMASWYGGAFNGLRSASGEIFDQEQLTAAHRTLPFGTRVRVRRLDSEESIVVRINDRGPFVDSRIIDLSYGAARRLGITDPGLVAVSLDIVEVPPSNDAHSFFAVQAGSFRNQDNARRTRTLMEQKYGAARIVAMHRDGDYWCVLVGHAVTQADAETLAAAVRKTDKAFQSAFIVKIDATLVVAD